MRGFHAHAHLIDATGSRLVVGNGYLSERTISTGAGPVEVKAPRVADKRPEDEREPFSSAILPRYMRTSPKVTEVLPVEVPAGAVHGRLRAGAGRVLRLGGGPVRLHRQPADRGVAGRARALVDP